MQVAVWIIIILVVIFLIWLLKRWIRRLIFVLILLALAFFIYGIFSPSGAARLWYNVRTFPQRMASRMSPDLKFLDYDSYKIDISSIGSKIGDKIGWGDDNTEELNFDDKIDVDVKSEKKDEKNISEDVDNSVNVDNFTSDKQKQVIKSFPKSIKFLKFPSYDQNGKFGNLGVLTGYSKDDLLGIISSYLETNLDDDTDILVTVEYEDGDEDPQKIILQTQPRSLNAK